MKYLLIVMALFCGSARADSQLISNALFCGLLAADRVQTGKISKSNRYSEKNPVFSKSPSIRSMNIYFPSACGVFVIANKYIPKKIHIYKKYYIHKKWLSRFTIGAQAAAVNHNINIGFSLRY